MVIWSRFKEVSYKYTLKDKVLKIGPSQTYEVDLLTDTLLILSDIPEVKMNPDRYNTLIFINENFYYDYIKEKGMVNYLNDSTLLANDYLYPYFSKGYVHRYLMEKWVWPSGNERSYVIGSMLIAPEGSVIEVNITKSFDFSPESRFHFIDLFLNAKGDWAMPELDQEYYYRMYFTARFLKDNGTKTILFSNNTQEEPCIGDCGSLTLEEIKNADVYFHNGLEVLEQGNFEGAIEKFSDCIDIDSLYLDAYYNRAYANYQLNKMENACVDWGYLKDLEQTEAIRLFNGLCKE